MGLASCSSDRPATSARYRWKLASRRSTSCLSLSSLPPNGRELVQLPGSQLFQLVHQVWGIQVLQHLPYRPPGAEKGILRVQSLQRLVQRPVPGSPSSPAPCPGVEGGSGFRRLSYSPPPPGCTDRISLRHSVAGRGPRAWDWIPAYAGMTVVLSGLAYQALSSTSMTCSVLVMGMALFPEPPS